MKIITKDAEFFAKLEIIDYSLLVGVHEKQKHIKNNAQNDSSVTSHSSLELGRQSSPYSARHGSTMLGFNAEHSLK